MTDNVSEVAFVIEQVLGHITHADNLRKHVPDHPDVRPSWILPTYETTGIGAHIPLYRSNWTVRSGLAARRRLRQVNSTRKLDAIFFHTQTPAMLCADWIRRVPSVISVDATPIQYDELGTTYQHEVGPAAVERLKTRATNARFERARRLVTWSDWAKRSLVADYSIPDEQVDVIPPGVTLDDWRSPRRTPATDRPVRILFVGGDLERKGGLQLIEAFRAIRDRGAELHIVTRDPVPDEKGVVVHSGVSPNSDRLRQLYADSDIFALPTLGDCLPMVLSEAGAAGLPTISTRLAAIPEVVVHRRTGLLTPPGDVRALGDALQRLIERPQERIEMGEAAVAHISRHYDTATNTSRLIDLLRVVAGASDDQIGSRT